MIKLLSSHFWKVRNNHVTVHPCNQDCTMYGCKIIEFVSWAANLQDLTENSLPSWEPRQQTVLSSSAPRPEETKVDCGNVQGIETNPHWWRICIHNPGKQVRWLCFSLKKKQKKIQQHLKRPSWTDWLQDKSSSVSGFWFSLYIHTHFFQGLGVSLENVSGSPQYWNNFPPVVLPTHHTMHRREKERSEESTADAQQKLLWAVCMQQGGCHPGLLRQRLHASCRRLQQSTVSSPFWREKRVLSGPWHHCGTVPHTDLSVKNLAKINRTANKGE